MSSDELRLNSLDRFRKSASRLVLEEHTHCEVPAGCGGVIMRWHNPDAGLPLLFLMAGPDEATLFLDGRELSSSRAVAGWGEHELTLHIAGVTAPRILLLATLRDIPESLTDVPHEQRRIASGCTADDGTWVAADGHAPADVGAEPSWQPLAAAQNWLADVDERDHWRYERLERFGAVALALPPDVEQCRVQTSFTLRREG